MSSENKTTIVGRDFIRSLVRGAYAIQQLRIQTGNRVLANYRHKLGVEAGAPEKDDKLATELLKNLRIDYGRITDGIAAETVSDEIRLADKLPSIRKFKASGLISSYAELTLVSQYFSFLDAEQREFKNLSRVLEEVPIYKHFLSTVTGLGPQIAGVIISEIDIYKAEYPSSIHAYAGLDTLITGYYVDDKGTEHAVRGDEVSQFYDDGDLNKTMKINGYPVQFRSVGRSRKTVCLVKRDYNKREGGVAQRDSITFNPWLKTKLIGVLGGNLLKQSATYVDNKEMGVLKRTALARELGWKSDSKNPNSPTKQVDDFLALKGYEVVFVPGHWAQYYYNYRNRISQMPEHKEKSDLHRHNMAVRYMIKRFLVELYVQWRTLEGLPVAEEYSVAKLGMVHGKAKGRPQQQGLNSLAERSAAKRADEKAV